MRSDAILTRLLGLHPKIIDLSLDRMARILAALGHPERKLPPVIHVAGTNGKGSTVAFLRSICEAAGLTVHAYTSPHLVKFHERIYLAGQLISEEMLSCLLEECETANGTAPITFFEITTAAAFLAFSRTPADYLILEVGLGGRLDATNMISHPKATVITPIDYDHEHYLGTTLTAIAHEKAGIIKKNAPVILALQSTEVQIELERVAKEKHAPIFIAGENWHCYEQEGHLVFQDDEGLLDLNLPQLKGRYQIDNAGVAIATIRAINDSRIDEAAINFGIKNAEWPARMQRLIRGELKSYAPQAEIWLDGGHNPAAGKMLAQCISDMNDKHSQPLILIWGMLQSKEAKKFIEPFSGLAQKVLTLTIPEESNALTAAFLAHLANEAGLMAEPLASIAEALKRAHILAPRARILICGSLYLAGHVLALNTGKEKTAISGTTIAPRNTSN